MPNERNGPFCHSGEYCDLLHLCELKTFNLTLIICDCFLFTNQLADGIMGMSAHPATLPRIMYDQGKLEHNMFSMCFRNELHVSKQGVVAGMLTLGGIDTRADYTPMVYARNVAATGWFTVFVKNLYVRNGGQGAKPDNRHQKLQRVTVDLFEINSGMSDLCLFFCM